MQVIDFETKTEMEAPEIIYLMCGDIHPRFKEYCVQTTHKEIMEGFESAQQSSLEERKGIFRSVYVALTKYTDDELNQHWESQTQEWTDWCNDVALFYVYRRLLFETAYIPIVDNPNKRLPSGVLTN